MRWLSFVLLGLSLPAMAQEVDGGTVPPPPALDAGFEPIVFTEPPEGVGRHFAFVWDAEGPKRGSVDVQVWATPRWGRVEDYAAVDLRAGFMQGLTRNWSAGLFVDATPSGSTQYWNPDIDGRLTLVNHIYSRIVRNVGVATHAEASFGLRGASLLVLLGGDAQAGPLRFALNVDGWLGAAWTTSESGGPWLTTWRLRQTFGVSFTLSNNFSLGVEVQNRQSWQGGGTFVGDAFLIGPSLAFRGKMLWFTLALLPQVAAIKTEANRGGDPLELNDNERFTIRLTLGLNSH
jgi:hypothetical protein